METNIDTEGMIEKFNITRTDGTDAPGCKHDGCQYLVLDLTHDAEGRQSALDYAERVKDIRPQYSKDLLATVGRILARSER